MRSVLRVAALTVLVLSVFAATGRAEAQVSTGSSPKSMNLRVSPILLLIGMIELNLDVAMNDQWTVGPELNFWRFTVNSSNSSFDDEFSLSAFALGVRANWYQNGVFSEGLYVGPYAKYVNVKVETEDSAGNDISGQASGLGLGCLVGYGWFWDSFNIKLGGGLALPLGTSNVEVKDSSGTTTEEVKTSRTGSLAAEFTLGWTF